MATTDISRAPSAPPRVVPRRRHLLAGCCLAALVAGAALASATAAARDKGQEMTPFRAITKQYHSQDAAIADGFHATNFCVEESGLGFMGFHYVNPDRVDRRLQLGRPEALLYAPGAGGTRRLVGLEYIVVDADQDLATDDDRPSLKGHAFDGPMPGHEPGMPVHYDLHIWAWHDNPAGRWSAWNTGLSC